MYRGGYRVLEKKGWVGGGGGGGVRVTVKYGPRPLNSTRRHGPILGLVTCDMAF